MRAAIILGFIFIVTGCTTTSEISQEKPPTPPVNVQEKEQVQRKDESNQTYKKDTTTGVDLEKKLRVDKEYTILKTRLENALVYSKNNPVKKSLSGLGEIKFSMVFDDIKRLKPNSIVELYGTGECTYQIPLYGCIRWREEFYGYPAKITVQFSSITKMYQIVMLFDEVKTEAACPKFKTSVVVSLVRNYGLPEYIDNKSIWHLDGGELTYTEICLNADYIPIAWISLKPITGI